jgi:peroxiredoxin Q/BCP
MPKAETQSATRRSARIASAGSAPKEEEPKPVEKKASKPKEPKEAKPKSAPKSKETKAKEPKSKEPKAKEPKSKEAKSKPKSKEDKMDEDKPAEAEAADKPEPKDEANGKPPSASRGVLQLGSGLPKITLQNEDGEDVDVSTLAGERGVVIFLYPRADTPGCTNQACGYRDLSTELGELGYDVYGLSKDKPAAQLKWKTKKEFKYHLLSDPESKLIKRLGAFIAPNNTKRSHFIFEKGSGKLIDIALGVKAAEDPKNALKFLQSHHK